jgi:hypothetical protein
VVALGPLAGAGDEPAPFTLAPLAPTPSVPSVPSHSPVAAGGVWISEAQARSSVQWLASLALRRLPRTVEGDKGWGETKRVWSGVKMRLDGLQLKTHRRFREVEHGRWVKYHVQLPPPDSPYAATVQVHRVVPVIDSVAGDQRWNIDSSIATPMTFEARIQRWNLGVRVYSVTVTGVMRVRLRSQASIGLTPDYAEIPPAMRIDPRIEQAQLELESFEVDRVSHVGGDVAEQWGEVIQEVLVERLIRAQNARLVSKLNESIDKDRDGLRISISDWLGSR